MSHNVKEFSRRAYPMAADAVIKSGDTVCLLNGYAVPGQAGTTLRAKGIAAESKDNTGGAAGALSVEVILSCGPDGVRSFKRTNDPGAGALAAADVGSKVYVLNATGVTKTTSGNSVAGELDRIDASGNPWVIFPLSY